MRVPWVAVLFLLLAGCVSPGAGPVPPVSVPADWAAWALPAGEGHDHHDPLQHADLSTPNFRVVGWDPLVTSYHGKSSGGYLCGAVAEAEGRRFAYVHSFTTDVAFVVADVTDPAAPTVVGELVLPFTHVYDVAVTVDAKRVLLATSQAASPPDAERGGSPGGSASPRFRDACTGEERSVRLDPGLPEAVPYYAGLVLVDVADPANPVVVDYRPLPFWGAHSVFTTNVDGEDLVVAAVANLLHPTSVYGFYAVRDGPTGPRLEELSIYRPLPGRDFTVSSGHVDGWIQKHPGTGQVLAYLADWDGGVVLLDLADLRAPREIGRWSRGEGDGDLAVHEAMPLDVLWEGRHYTIAGQEILTHPSDRPTGLVSVLDTTDPTRPERVSAWTLPTDVEWSKSLQFSTHYVAVVDRTMFVAMYHGGLWAVDLSNVTAPRTAGVFVPDRVSPSPPGKLAGSLSWTPTVLDVVALPEGGLITWDATSGIYLLGYDASRPAPRPKEWPTPGAS